MDALLRPVDTERALPLMLSALDSAGLSEPAFSQRLQAGTCSVLAPSTVSVDQLYQISAGGIAPRGQHVSHAGYVLSEVKCYSDALAHALIEKQKFRTYYVHDPLKRPQEVTTVDGPTVTAEGQLLYVREAAHLSPEEFSRFVSKNSLSWHFLMFCTRTPPTNYEQMSDLLSDTDCLVAGIYDGESYMVWTAPH